MAKLNLNKKESDNKGKVIRSTIILEVIGKPPEHLVQTLENLAKQIDEEKGVKVISKKMNEPVPIKDSKDFYTTFAEIDLEVEDILYLAIIMFKYMPAHVEVIEPELIALTNNGWTDILSELARRLHGYEEVARMLQLQNSKMQKKLRELIPETSKTEDKKEKKINTKEKKE